MRLLLLALAIALPPHIALAAGDAAAGKSVFHKCAICHSVSAGQNRVGPSLFGIVGRKAGTQTGYTYSDAMKNSGKTWNEATLNTYLEHPRDVVPGTKMSFGGIEDATDRVNLIAYLATQK